MLWCFILLLARVASLSETKNIKLDYDHSLTLCSYLKACTSVAAIFASIAFQLIVNRCSALMVSALNSGLVWVQVLPEALLCILG